MGEAIIKPHHLFQYQGSWYIINVEKMFADGIEAEMAEAIGKLSPGPAEQLAPPVQERLRQLGLLSDGGGAPPGAKRQINKDPIPVANLGLFVTQSCNLRCVYCYGDGGEYGHGGDMDGKTALQAVDWLLAQAGNTRKLYIGFFGGEPFINFPLMKAIVAYAEQKARETGKEVGFHATTNATLLEDETIAFIKEHRMEVMVSIDGPKELQDAQRPYADGRGSYDHVMPRIKKLLHAVPETRGHAVIVGDTDPDMVKSALREIGFAEISVLPASRSLFAAPQDEPNPARDTRPQFLALEREAENWLDLIKRRDHAALARLKEKNGLFTGIIGLLHNFRRRHACGAGRGLAAVSAAGDIYLCHRFVGQEEYKLGSVFAPGLDRDEYQKSPVAENAECTACFAKYCCGGGCRHDNAGACGSTTTPSGDICRLKRREFELAAVVACNLSPEDRGFLAEHGIVPPKPCPFDF